MNCRVPVCKLKLRKNGFRTSQGKAHRHQRKAESLLRHENFDGAISHHKKAEELLLQALDETASPSAQESIRLQIDYHCRQQDIIKHRQKELERLQQEILRIKQSKHVKENETESLPTKNEKSAIEKLKQQAIITMGEHDSLLGLVVRGTHYNSDDSSSPGLMSLSVGNTVKTGIKSPKDDMARLEELNMNNEELRRILFSLISELDKCRAENKQLRKSLEELRKVHESCPPPAVVQPSSHSDLRNISGICELPALAPVEMPKLDSYRE